jgi:hypothetical protein
LTEGAMIITMMAKISSHEKTICRRVIRT